MFGDALSLSGISPVAGFAAGETAGMPTFNYGAGMSGNASAAQSAYQTCIAGGGSTISCGASAWKAGLENSSSVSTSPNPQMSYWDKWKCTFSNSPECKASQKAFDDQVNATVNKSIGGMTVNMIVTLLIGLLLIGASLFLLKSPVSIISSAIKEGT